MKICKKIMAGITAAAVAAAMAIPAIAEESVPAEKVRPAMKVELTDEQKAEVLEKAKAAIDEKLASGELTQEQYDEIAAKIESGDLRGFGGKRHGGCHGKPGSAAEETAEETAA